MNIDEAANALGMKAREVVRVTKDREGGHLVLTVDGNLVHLDDDGAKTPAGRVPAEELAEAVKAKNAVAGPPAPVAKRR